MIHEALRALSIAMSPILVRGPKVLAAPFTWNGSGCLENGDVATIQCLVPMFKNIVTAAIELAGVALFIALIIGGYNFLMSGGNPKQMEQAKNTLTYAIIGIVIVVAAFLIILIIENITGVKNLHQFTIPDYTKTP